RLVGDRSVARNLRTNGRDAAAGRRVEQCVAQQVSRSEHQITARSTIVLALTLLGLSFLCSPARCEPVFDPPSEKLSIHPLAQHGDLYGAARESAALHVAQWNNP